MTITRLPDELVDSAVTSRPGVQSGGITARGPLSAALLETLLSASDTLVAPSVGDCARSALADTTDILIDDDIQLSLFLLYGLHYGSVPGVDDGWEWHPEIIAVRRVLEAGFERALRERVTVPEHPDGTAEGMAALLFRMTAPTPGPGLSRYIARSATLPQAREFLILRSIYTLREADPHSWAIPRIRGRAKTALVEIQFDEYGSGDPERSHAEIFAGTMRSLGLDPTYPAYIDFAPAVILASQNMMSMFGLNRRLRGAIAGHLAAFEMTSSLPNRSYGDGFRRLGFDEATTDYFDEHVEADAVHEQIAGRDLAGALSEDEPDLIDDIVFGAAACLFIDDLAGAHALDAWQSGRSALRDATAGKSR